MNHDAPSELFINQLTPSTLNWRAGHLKLTLDASPFASDNVLRANITLESYTKPRDGSKASILRLRVPAWIVPGQSSVTLHNNDEVLHLDQDILPGGYLSLKRDFKSGMP